MSKRPSNRSKKHRNKGTTPQTTREPKRSCARCDKRFRGRGPWNVTLAAGRIAEYLCPECQTPEENAEAEINLATLNYATDALGRIVGRPKVHAG